MRVRSAALLALLAGIATACATGARIDPTGSTAVDTATPRTITYETSPCFGACPVYALTLDTATGAGTFAGKRFTAVAGTRAFTATPAQSLAFSTAVDEVRRSESGAYEPGGAHCAMQATDMPGVTITWSGGGAEATTRRVYFGCGMDANRAMFARLRTAPDALPVADFIARR